MATTQLTFAQDADAIRTARQRVLQLQRPAVYSASFIATLLPRLPETPDPRQAVVGNWSGTAIHGRYGTAYWSGEGQIAIAFREDGTVSTNTSGNGLGERGNWSISGETVTIIWTWGSSNVNNTTVLRMAGGQLSGLGTTRWGQPWQVNCVKR